MDDLVAVQPRIAAMSDAAIDNVRRLEGLAAAQPQVPIVTEHVIHGGMYARTVCIPAGTMITGVLIKRATLLIVHGDALAYVGDDGAVRFTGNHVVPASAGRKQAFVAIEPTYLTMLFPTQSRTVEDAEREFTDEGDILLSRRAADSNRVTITGE